MKVLVVDGWYAKWQDGVIQGGAERSMLEACKILGADLYAPSHHTTRTKIFGGTEIIPAGYPSRGDGTMSSRAANEVRTKEITSLVLREGYDVIFNQSASAGHVSGATAAALASGAGLVNFNHNSMYDFTFPKFATVDALWKSKMNAGAVNLTTSPAVIQQARNLIVKKRDMLKTDPREDDLFDGFVPPAAADTISGDGTQSSLGLSLSVVTRFAEDKNVDELVDFMEAWYTATKTGIKCCFSVIDEESVSLLESKRERLSKVAAFVVNKKREECFDFVKSQSVHLFASHTESFGLTACEMAAFGQPTVFCEKHDRVHSLRSVLVGNGIPAVKKDRKKPWKHESNLSVIDDIVNRVSSFSRADRIALAKTIREEYSTDKISSRLIWACEESIRRKTDRTENNSLLLL